jgi:PST family polysaccharide transporter
VYGPEWAPAAEVLQLLGIIAAAKIFGELTYDYLAVRGKTHVVLVAQVIWLVALIPALIFGSHLGGIDGAALSQVCVTLALVVPIYLALLRRCDIPLGKLGRGAFKPLIAGIAIWFIGFIISTAELASAIQCLLTGFITIGAIALLLRPDRDLIRNAIRSRHPENA